MAKNSKKKTVPTAKRTVVDPVELVIKHKPPEGEIYSPQPVNRSIVTMEQVTSLLQEIPLSQDMEERIRQDKYPNFTKVSLPDEVLESSVVQTAALGTFPRAVLEAVLSQLQAGNNTFTSSMIYRTMTAKTAGESVTAGQQEQIDAAMNQLMFTPLSIDLSLYGENGDIEGDGQLKGPIVPAEQLTINIAGNTCTAYQITNTPILYRFCKATKSMTVTPAELLAVKMNYTRRNLAILNYLQRRIAPLIYPVDGPYAKPAPLVIRYESIYEVAMEDMEDKPNATLTPTERARIRDIVARILNTWTEGRYLAKWEEMREGREVLACKLHFPRSSPPELPLESFNPKKLR